MNRQSYNNNQFFQNYSRSRLCVFGSVNDLPLHFESVEKSKRMSVIQI